VTAAILAVLNSLYVVGRSGLNIDADTANELGIMIFNVSEYRLEVCVDPLAMLLFLRGSFSKFYRVSRMERGTGHLLVRYAASAALYWKCQYRGVPKCFASVSPSRGAPHRGSPSIRLRVCLCQECGPRAIGGYLGTWPDSRPAVEDSRVDSQYSRLGPNGWKN